MKTLYNLQEIFTNREIALILWIFIAVVAIIFSTIRNSFFRLIKTLTYKTFLLIYFLIGIYLTGIILIFKKIAIWNCYYLKDILFWLFSAGLVYVFKIDGAKNNSYFKNIIFSAISGRIIVEFILNFYTFSLLAEIIILPLFVYVVAIQAFAEVYQKNKTVTSLLQKIITISIVFVFCYSLYKTIINYKDVFTVKVLIELLLPSTIAILCIPFLYCLALYITYESYFITLNCMTSKKDKVKKVKKLILRTANINLGKLNRISKNFEKRVFYDDTNLKSYIQTISREM